VGQRADFAVIATDASPLAGIPAANLLDALLFSSPDAGSRRTFVAGQEVLARPDATAFTAAMRQLWGT
jgi:cytosine/adenosine deaminase-related metal-dependent hydrolase